VSSLAPSPAVKRRWDRFWLKTHARLDGDAADRAIPWIAAISTFVVHVALAVAARRSGVIGSGLGPWLQASWDRANGGAAVPLGGADPARASASLVGEAVLQLTRFVSATELFIVVQALAIAATIFPLWRLARDRAHLRAGASIVVVLAYALAPTLHRASLTPFHPELVALPALLWAYLVACRTAWVRYWVLIVLALCSRADLGLTVAVLGLVIANQHDRRHGFATTALGVVWLAAASLVTDTSLPSTALTPAGEFVARSVGPLAVVPEVLSDPLGELGGLLTEPSVQFLVVVLAPLLFLPLVSLRRFSPALACLALAMVADRTVQRAAEVGVLNLSPVAAHITPALAFVFLALVLSLERIGTLSVVRVNVDRRLLSALLVGAVLFFVTESPSTPYDRPWSWGGRGAAVQDREEIASLLPELEPVAVSPTATALVALRPRVVELPPAPDDLDEARLERVAEEVAWVVLDTTPVDPVTLEPRWRDDDVERVLDLFADLDFAVEASVGGVYLLTSG
jgi:hypothetical protein